MKILGRAKLPLFPKQYTPHKMQMDFSILVIPNVQIINVSYTVEMSC